MKKIMILNGAGKKSGNTAALIKAFTEGAESSGNEVKEFYLQAMNIHGCRAVTAETALFSFLPIDLSVPVWYN